MSTEREYLVRWEIQVTAESPQEAALGVWDDFIFQAADLGEATNLDVYDADEAIAGTHIGYISTFDMGEIEEEED